MLNKGLDFFRPPRVNWCALPPNRFKLAQDHRCRLESHLTLRSKQERRSRDHISQGSIWIRVRNSPSWAARVIGNPLDRLSIKIKKVMNVLQTFIYELDPRCLRKAHLVVVLIESDGLIGSEHHLEVSWLQKVDLQERVSRTTSYLVDRTTQIIIKTYVHWQNNAYFYRNICSLIERRRLLLEHLFADRAT